MLNNKKLTFSLIGLYLLPWGIQYLITNFMSVYVSALPFATEKTVGEVLGIGAIVTCLSQTVWPWWAGKAKNKSNVLFLSLVLLTAISLLFLDTSMTKTMLYVYVILFYGCYMVHQPLIDTICSETYTQTKFGFGFFRSFASLGFALAGIVLSFVPNDRPTLFFLYSAVLAAVSALLSKTVYAPRVERTQADENKNIFNATYIKFLIYTFILFIGCSSITGFFALYYTEGLGGDLGVFSLVVGVAAVAEWLVVMLFSKVADKIKAKYTFGIVALAGVFRALTIYLAPNSGVAALALVFATIWYGLMWASVTPYIKKIVPADGNAFAQGIWTVVSSGAGTFVGSYVSGIFSEIFGLKLLFLLMTIVMAVLTVLTPILIKD